MKKIIQIYKQTLLCVILILVGATELFAQFRNVTFAANDVGNSNRNRSVQISPLASQDHKSVVNFDSSKFILAGRAKSDNFQYSNTESKDTNLLGANGKNSASIDLTTDSDGDTVPDHLDLDDDNDGILDVNENTTSSGQLMFWNNGSGSTAAGTNSVVAGLLTGNNSTAGSGLTRTMVPANHYQSISGVAATSESTAMTANEYIEYTANVGSKHIIVDRIGYYSILSTWDNTTYNYSLRVSDDNFASSTQVHGTNTYVTGNGDLFYNTNQPLYLEPNTTYTFRVYFYNVSGGTSANFGHDDFKLFGIVETDTDGDGIPNRLDLDSDNDGCPDAIEGGSTTITPTNLVDSLLPGGNTGATSGTYNASVIQNLGNAVNTTSTSPRYGVPTIAVAGQAVGTSATANPVLAAGTASSDQMINSGTAPAALTLASSTGTIQWQVSTDNSTFTNVTTGTGGTTVSYSPGTLTATRYYRALLTSAGGCTALSNVVTIMICNAGNVAPIFNTTALLTYNNVSTKYSYKIPCGSLTADLSTVTASNKPAPSAVVITWHNSATATDANKIANVTAIVGTRKIYAAFYDTVNLCYSATQELTVQAPICASPDDYTATPVTYGTPMTLTPSIFANDSYNGASFTGPHPSILFQGELWTTEIVVNPDGTLTVTPSPTFGVGTHTLLYSICDKSPDAITTTACSNDVNVIIKIVAPCNAGTTQVPLNGTVLTN